MGYTNVWIFPQAAGHKFLIIGSELNENLDHDILIGLKYDHNTLKLDHLK